MKKKFLTLLLALVMCLGLLPTAALAAEYTVTELVPMGTYGRIEEFSEGLAVVGFDTGERTGTGRNSKAVYKYGFIDQAGKEVVPCKYDFASSFSEGLAVVALDGKYGYIDKTGREVVPLGKYTWAYAFSEGLAVVCIDSGEKDKRDEPIYKYGYIDKTGTEVVPCKYDSASSFSGGLGVVGIATGETSYYGFRYMHEGLIDKTGKEIVPCTYYYDIRRFTNEYGEECKDYWLVQTEIDRDGYSSYSRTESRGVIDNTGRLVLPCKYGSIDPFFDGDTVVGWDVCWNGMDPDLLKQDIVRLRYLTGFVDLNGQLTDDKTGLGSNYYFQGKDIADGITASVVTGKDKWGNRIEKYGLSDAAGNMLTPYKYSSMWRFSEDLMWVEVEVGVDEWGDPICKGGFIDRTGREVIPCEYDSAEDFNQGLARVKLNNEWGLIDKTGREVVPIGKYGRNYFGGFSEGFARVMVPDSGYGKYGVIDTAGKEVIPCEYDTIRRLGNFMALGTSTGEHRGMSEEIFKYGLVGIYDNATTAFASTQDVNIDGKAVEFQMYALKDENGNPTNYVKLRDLADILDGTAAQFNVVWSADTGVGIETGKAYTSRNGQEGKTPYSGNRSYVKGAETTQVDGQAVELQSFKLTDDNGGQSTYYKLRDLGQALGFNVGYADGKGVFIETDKAYDPNN